MITIAPSHTIPAGAGAPEKIEALVLRERRELEQANALAVHLSGLKLSLWEAGRLPAEEVQRLQQRHRRHLDRCLRLRSRLGALRREQQ